LPVPKAASPPVSASVSPARDARPSRSGQPIMCRQRQGCAARYVVVVVAFHVLQEFASPGTTAHRVDTAVIPPKYSISGPAKSFRVLTAKAQFSSNAKYSKSAVSDHKLLMHLVLVIACQQMQLFALVPIPPLPSGRIFRTIPHPTFARARSPDKVCSPANVVIVQLSRMSQISLAHVEHWSCHKDVILG
jgi:hypothetical protein